MRLEVLNDGFGPYEHRILENIQRFCIVLVGKSPKKPLGGLKCEFCSLDSLLLIHNRFQQKQLR